MASDKNKENLRKTMERLKRFRIQEGDSFQERMYKAAGLASVHLQKEITRAIDSPVPFSQKSIWYKTQKVGQYKKLYRMGIMDNQDVYLSAIIDRKKPTDKLIPVDKKFTDKYGNIKGLAKNLKNGKYKKVEQTNQTILINTAAKKRNNRMIAIRKVSKRKHKIDWDQMVVSITKMINQRVKK